MTEHRPHRDPGGEPRALGWINADISPDIDADRAAVEQLAARLGYRLVWPDEISVLPVIAQLPNIGADALLMPNMAHLDPGEVDRVTGVVDVETVHPRRSFARRSIAGAVTEAGSC